jgi:ABC-type uncharacterized transport system fused permease/ATPase subunit
VFSLKSLEGPPTNLEQEQQSNDRLYKKLEEVMKMNGQSVCVSEKLKKEFVLTHDNFIKVVMLNQRIKSGRSVLIQGHTGIGKSYLLMNYCALTQSSYEQIIIH